MSRTTIFFHKRRKSRSEMLWKIVRKKNSLTKQEKIIQDMYHAFFCISETCVEASKLHITLYEAVDKIRNYLSELD